MLFETAPASDEMVDHVNQLVLGHGITVTWSEPETGLFNWFDSCGDLETRSIIIGPITDEMSYFVALHEIAHVVLRIPTDVPLNGVSRVSLDNEVTVWAWAIGQALASPSAATGDAIMVALYSHVADAHQEGGAQARWRLTRLIGLDEPWPDKA